MSQKTYLRKFLRLEVILAEVLQQNVVEIGLNCFVGSKKRVSSDVIIDYVNYVLIGNSRILIQNLLNHLLCYTDIKESCLFVAETLITLDQNTSESLDDLATGF